MSSKRQMTPPADYGGQKRRQDNDGHPIENPREEPPSLAPSEPWTNPLDYAAITESAADAVTRALMKPIAALQQRDEFISQEKRRLEAKCARLEKELETIKTATEEQLGKYTKIIMGLNKAKQDAESTVQELREQISKSASENRLAVDAIMASMRVQLTQALGGKE